MAELQNIPWKRISVEAIAIVASILLAFTIDAWWEDAQSEHEEKQILEALLVDLISRQERLDAQRTYIFANMTQEWIAEPVMLAEADSEAEASIPELAAALQAIVDQAVADGSPGAVLMVDAPDMNFTWKGAAGMADAGKRLRDDGG